MWCGWVFVLKGNEKMLQIGLCTMVLFLCVRKDGGGRVVTCVK